MPVILPEISGCRLVVSSARMVPGDWISRLISNPLAMTASYLGPGTLPGPPGIPWGGPPAAAPCPLAASFLSQCINRKGVNNSRITVGIKFDLMNFAKLRPPRTLFCPARGLSGLLDGQVV